MNQDIDTMDANVENQFKDLIAQIKGGSIERVEFLLRNNSHSLVNKLESQFRQPPLYFAALAGSDELSAEMIKLLLRYGANAKYKDHNEQTVLFYLCRQGKQKCTEILLTHGLSLDEVDVYGQTPMFYAISQNKIEIVRKYATKQRLNHVDKLVGQTPLYYAARRGHLDLCKLLIEKGANVEHLDNSNKTAAEYAKKAKFSQTAQYLINELRKIKDCNKTSSVQESIRKLDISKQAKQTYKIVFFNQKGQTHDLNEQEAYKLIENIPQLKEFLSKPDSISQQQLQTVQSQTWQKVALKVVNACCKIKGSFYFLQPVDPVKFNIMDYFDIISKPMDLGTVKKRLLHNYYLKAEQFVGDMQLIWQNSYKYNGDAHIVSKAGKQLQASFKDLIISSGLAKYL